MNSFVWKISLFRFLEASKLIGVIFTLFFQANGLTPFQISILITIWSATQLVLEVPLGAIADKYPRRNLLIVALLFLVAGYFLWLIGGFVFYAIGFVLWGVKNALTSGTLEAFIYDELKSFGKEDRYEEVNGKLETSFWIGVTLSAVLGGFVASINFDYVLWGSIFVAILSMIPLLAIKSVQPKRSTEETKYLKVLKEALMEVRTNTRLLEITIFFCLVFATYGAADEYWALLYQELGSPTALTGILVAVGYGLFAISGSTIHLFRFKNAETVLIIVSAFLFIFAGIMSSFFSIPIILIALYLFKVAHIKYDVAFQHAILGAERATISSLKSLIFEIIYMAMVLIFGFITTGLGLSAILLFLGILLLFWLITLKLAIKNVYNKF